MTPIPDTMTLHSALQTAAFMLILDYEYLENLTSRHDLDQYWDENDDFSTDLLDRSLAIAERFSSNFGDDHAPMIELLFIYILLDFT